MIRTEYKGSEWLFPFVAYTPEKIEGTLPLVVQLHGAGERGDGDLDKMDIIGFSHLLKERDYNAIVVMPQCPSNEFWVARTESVIKFIEDIKEHFAVDSSRVSLCGISMGGFGTWYTAMFKPQLFSAIAPCCGGGMPWNARVLDMPVYAIHGTADSVVNVLYTDEMVDALKGLSRQVIYKRIEGVGHNSWDYTFDSELLEWLISKKR